MLVIHFGTPSRQNDCARRQPLGPGSPRSGPLLRHEQRPLGAFGLRNGPTANGLTACGMRFAYPLRGFGSSPLRHCGCTHAPTPTGDYAPSLRSPWRAAYDLRYLNGMLRTVITYLASTFMPLKGGEQSAYR